MIGHDTEDGQEKRLLDCEELNGQQLSRIQMIQYKTKLGDSGITMQPCYSIKNSQNQTMSNRVQQRPGQLISTTIKV